MLICKSCKAEMADGTYFCEKCGELMVEENSAAAPSGNPALSFTRTSTAESFAPAPSRLPGAGGSPRQLGEFNVSLHDDGKSGLRKLAMGGLVGSGKLIIYSDRVEFKPGTLNMLDKAIVMPMEDITAVNVTNVVFVVPNGVQIVLRSGKKYVFLPSIWDKARLVEMIQSQMHHK